MVVFIDGYCLLALEYETFAWITSLIVKYCHTRGAGYDGIQPVQGFKQPVIPDILR